jgi:antitoxin (DNA-binding transcriptional repressor) of toxin-antitoxin stability system
MHEAKTHLSRFVRELREGKEPEIIIAVGNTPAARLVPYVGSSRRVLGIDRGLIEMTGDFDDVDKEIAELFEGTPSRKRAQR